jgi:hypothetical protein
MKKKHIIFVPGKSPKPSADQHKNMLWRTLLEGVSRAEPNIAVDIEKDKTRFNIVAWNYAYYQHNRDIAQDLSNIDTLLTQHGPTPQDIREASSWRNNLNRFLFTIADHFPLLIRWVPESTKNTIEETNAYFENHGNIGYEIRGMLKTILRPMLDKNEPVLIIGHSLGSVIVYDALWELSRYEAHTGKVDFLSIGSPLGLKFVQSKLQGRQYSEKNKYPSNIRRWINLSSVGDTTAVDKHFNDDFADMLKYGLVESIEDHHEGIYNFYRDDEGLDSHSSYGYLVNPAVGHIIAKWWRGNAEL